MLRQLTPLLPQVLVAIANLQLVIENTRHHCRPQVASQLWPGSAVSFLSLGACRHSWLNDGERVCMYLIASWLGLLGVACLLVVGLFVVDGLCKETSKDRTGIVVLLVTA